MKDTNLFTNFEKLFNKNKIEENDDILKEELKGYLDKTNCVMIIPKKKSIKELMLKNFDVKDAPVPELDYNIYEIDEQTMTKRAVVNRCEGGEGLVVKNINSVKISCEFLNIVLKMTLHTEDLGLTFYQKRNYPMTIDCSEMKVIIAPRVEEM